MPPHLSLSRYFSRLPDPRLRRCQRYSLGTLLFICLCAVLSGAESGPSSIAVWAKAKEKWLRERVALPDTLPSHDTIGRVLSLLNSKAFDACFREWTQSLHQWTEGEVIALDGKTVRGSLDRASGVPSLHLVSAWAASNRLVLCQRKVEGHENEICAVPDLLSLLEVRGCIVTGDALLCQKEVAQKVVEQKGDYVLALKQNHPAPFAGAQEYFDYWMSRGWRTEIEEEPVAHQFAITRGKGHGRIEERRCFVVEACQIPGWTESQQEWAGLKSVAAVTCGRKEMLTGKLTTQTRYFLTSLAGPDAAKKVLRAVRQHWGIENRLHWVLDVVFQEDRSRTRSTTAAGNTAQNLALLNKIALNVIRQDKTEGIGGVKSKRLTAGWNVEFLEALLTGKTYEIKNWTKLTIIQ